MTLKQAVVIALAVAAAIFAWLSYNAVAHLKPVDIFAAFLLLAVGLVVEVFVSG